MNMKQVDPHNNSAISNGKSNKHDESECNEMDDASHFSYDLVQGIAGDLLKRTTYRPKIGIICGSGLGSLAENIKNVNNIPYEDIPNFPVTTVPGHSGQMIFGTLNNVPVMCMQGRFHYYEGYSLAKCCMPIRVMKLVGVTHLIVTNASGALNENYNVGDIVILKDHINLMGFIGHNPLRGSNDTRFGPRFPCISKPYDEQMRIQGFDIIRELGIENRVHEGVYTCTGGPNYETIAEVKLLKSFGIDCVGMSTVHEVITANHCGIRVFAFSIITNKCIEAYDSQDTVNHESVIEAANNQQDFLAELVHRIVAQIDSN